LRNQVTLQKKEEEALPLAIGLDVFPEFCLEVAWYLAVKVGSIEFYSIGFYLVFK
jgi:hypothetical protein